MAAADCAESEVVPPAKEASESSLKRKAQDPLPIIPRRRNTSKVKQIGNMSNAWNSLFNDLQVAAAQHPALQFVKVGESGTRRRSSSQPEPPSEPTEVMKRGRGRPAASQQPRAAKHAT